VKKTSILFLVIIFILLIYSSAYAGKTIGHVYYSGEVSTLDSYPEDIISQSSTGGFSLMWGPSWYQHIEFDSYSKRSLFPLELGMADYETNLYALSAITGLPFGIWSLFIYSISNIQQENGIPDNTDEWTTYYDKNGRQISVQKNLNKGCKYEMFLIGYDIEKEMQKKMTEAEKRLRGNWESIYAIGMGKMTFSGYETQKGYYHTGWIDKIFLMEETSYGLAVRIRMKKNAKYYTFAVVGDIIATLGGGGMEKTGYEFGLNIKVDENKLIRPFVGGYFWLITGYGVDFETIDTTLGYTVGLEFDWSW